MDQAIKYVWDCQDLKGNGGFRYQKLDGPAGFARSAAALSALHQAGVKEKKEELEKGLAYLRAFKPRPNQERAEPLFFHHYYGQYYAAQAMRSSGDKDWRPWYPAIRDDLLASRKDNHWPDTISPHYGTAIALIILQMPMNDLPKKNP